MLTAPLPMSVPPTNEQLSSYRRRYGRITVSRELLLHQVLGGSAEALAAFNAVFTNFVVVKAEADFRTDVIIYEGYHPQFDEVPENCSTENLYEAQISRVVEDHGITTYTCKMVHRSW